VGIIRDKALVDRGLIRGSGISERGHIREGAH
jgi:hypothetical protein